MQVSGGGIPGRGKSKHEGGEMGVCLAWRNSKEVIVTGSGGMMGVKSEVRRGGSSLAFIWSKI